MKRTDLTLLLLLALLPFLFGGCLSNLFGRSAGGERIWWCDQCQGRIGSPETHVCKYTQYDKQTGTDEVMEDVTPDGLAYARAEQHAGPEDGVAPVPSSAPVKAASPTPRKSRWKFWRRD